MSLSGSRRIWYSFVIPPNSPHPQCRAHLELLLKRPVFQRLLLHDIDIGVLAFKGVPVNLPCGTPVRLQLRRKIGRQSNPLSLSRTRSRFQLLSEESLKFIMMLEMPARLNERKFFMSGMPAMAISHGTVICFSMSSAECPGHCVMMFT